jgi:hypothetical protein
MDALQVKKGSLWKSCLALMRAGQLFWILYESPALFLLAACGFHPLVVPMYRDGG